MTKYFALVKLPPLSLLPPATHCFHPYSYVTSRTLIQKSDVTSYSQHVLQVGQANALQQCDDTGHQYHHDRNLDSSGHIVD